MSVRVCAVAALIALGGGLAAAKAAPAYEVRIPRTLQVDRAGVGVVSITLIPLGGHVISRDGPIRIEVASGAGCSAKPGTLRRRHAIDPEAEAPRFEVTLQCKGPERVKFGVQFWVCGRRTCEPVNESREVVVTPTALVPEPDGGVLP